jgi:ubiquinone/menaquinone biosynthesis C-methylase UbiE
MDWKWKREIRLQYDIEANGYDELYSQEQRKKHDLAVDHLNALNGKEQILDSGCGTGDFLERVACNVEFAVGIDFSSKALQRARLKLNRLSNVDLVCADFDFLPFAMGTFTHIFMFTALPAPANWSVALSEAMEALAVTGILILSVPKKEISSEELLAKLKKSGLEPRELMAQQETPDYVFIGERAHVVAG